MNNHAKMIILTSNEDLIEQLSLNKSENTRVIELDQNKPIPSSSKENHNHHNPNLLDLTFLAQFSELVCI